MIIEVLPAPRKPVKTVIGMAAITGTGNLQGRSHRPTSHTLFTDLHREELQSRRRRY